MTIFKSPRSSSKSSVAQAGGSVENEMICVARCASAQIISLPCDLDMRHSNLTRRDAPLEGLPFALLKTRCGGLRPFGNNIDLATNLIASLDPPRGSL